MMGTNPLRSLTAGFRSRYSPREQAVWLSLLVATVLVLLWLTLWQPLLERQTRAGADLDRLARDIAWLENAAPRVMNRTTAATTEAISPEQGLTGLVTSSSSQFGLELTRYEQSGETGLRVWLEDQPFEDLLEWLVALDARNTNADQVVITRGNTPGRVSARILLNRNL